MGRIYSMKPYVSAVKFDLFYPESRVLDIEFCVEYWL